MSSDGAVKRSGELLLKGWTMLSSHCPICYSALFSNKDRTECVCPSCNVPVKTESEVKSMGFEVEVINPSGSATLGLSKIADDLADDDVEEEEDLVVPSSLEEMKKEWEAKTRSRDRVSGWVGEAMLLGWTMLSTCCDKAMKNHPEYDSVLLVSKDGVTKCVACEKLGTVATQPISAEVSAPIKSSMEYPPSQVSFSMSSSEPTGDISDKCSGKIGEYLLKGYTLLDETCNRNANSACFQRVPLVKSFKSDDKICVFCSDNGMSPASAGSPMSKQKVRFANPVAARDDMKDAALDSDEDDDDTDASQKVSQMQGIKRLEAAAFAAAKSWPDKEPSGRDFWVKNAVGKDSNALVLEDARDAVIQKITQLTTEMASTTHLVAIQQYSETIKGLVSLAKEMATV